MNLTWAQFSSSTSYFTNIILVLPSLLIHLLTLLEKKLFCLRKTSPGNIILFFLLDEKGQSSAIICSLLLSVTLAFLFLGSSLLTVTVNACYNPGSGSVHLFSLTCISGLATSNTIFLHSSLESNATASSRFWMSWPFIQETNESGTLVSISTKQHTIKGRYQLICAECMDNENCATGSSSAPQW